MRAKRRLFRELRGYLECEACGLRPNPVLADCGEACFEAHHLKPLSELKGVRVTRLEDLAILCSNCHRIIHRFDSLPTLETFRAAIAPSPQ